MAWSDAARRAAAEARRLRSQLKPLGRAGQIEGRRAYFEHARGTKQMSSKVATVRTIGGERAARGLGTLNRLKTRVKSIVGLRHRQRLDEAYQYSIRNGLHGGKKRGGFFT